VPGRQVTIIGVMGLMTAHHAEASGVNGCRYDLVAYDEFIPGPVPGVDEVVAGVGWRGTGYRFAPWAGRVLAQLALQQGTGYDIRRFAPARFAGGSGPGGLKAGGAVS
jgi:hypothetical protein